MEGDEGGRAIWAGTIKRGEGVGSGSRRFCTRKHMTQGGEEAGALRKVQPGPGCGSKMPSSLLSHPLLPSAELPL